MTPTLGDYLAVSGLLFAIGLAGVILRRNILIIFMCLELMLNAANLSLVAFSRYNLTVLGLPNYNAQVSGIFCHNRGRRGGRRRSGNHRGPLSLQTDNPRRGSEQPEILMNAATVPWIILFAPLVSATLILLFGKFSTKSERRTGHRRGTAFLRIELVAFLPAGRSRPESAPLDQHP